MKSITLYDVRHIELKRNIEYFLDDEYEIIGYSDTWYESDVIDGKRFIPLQQLSCQPFDYIVPLSYKESVLTDMCDALRKHGGPAEKIVKPVMFIHQNAEKMQLDLVKDTEESCSGQSCLIFGLSYSLCGINKSALRISAYDCSWQGPDLYYNYKLFKNIKSCGRLPGGSSACFSLLHL